jgi:hypothetical protein
MSKDEFFWLSAQWERRHHHHCSPFHTWFISTCFISYPCCPLTLPSSLPALLCFDAGAFGADRDSTTYCLACSWAPVSFQLPAEHFVVEVSRGGLRPSTAGLPDGLWALRTTGPRMVKGRRISWWCWRKIWFCARVFLQDEFVMLLKKWKQSLIFFLAREQVITEDEHKQFC